MRIQALSDLHRISGNAIPSFSWFGVNMLGVGLHSYGFMDKAFPWLVGFSVLQFVLALLTRLPSRFWKSSGTSVREMPN